MTDIPTRLQAVRERIAAAARATNQPTDSISLLAVSKKKPAGDIRAALAAGQRAFGENYLQEALEKIEQLAGEPVEWHFIGRIQSNKTRDIAENFDWVQTVDRARVVRRLGQQRPTDRPPLNVLLQVNIDAEEQKAGALPAALPELARLVADTPGLRLRGLMAIPQVSDDPAVQAASARRLRQAFDALRASGFGIDTLSIGMSGDLEAAIAEGSTMVRIGTAIFGERV